MRARAFLDYLDPARGIYTALSIGAGNITLVGQITHASNSRSSNFSFLTPIRGLSSPELLALVDHLAEQAGAWGTFHLLAETDEHSNAFDVLKKTGFSVYAWQRIWKYQPQKMDRTIASPYHWSTTNDRDQIAIKSLCLSLVPAFIQPVDQIFDKRLDGFVCRSDCNIVGYADMISGRDGVWIQPYIHPEADHVAEILADLMQQVEQQGLGPIYICVRSYQAWIESALEDLPVLASPRQALMVRHLAMTQKVSNSLLVPSFEKKTNPSVAHVEQHKRV